MTALKLLVGLCVAATTTAQFDRSVVMLDSTSWKDMLESPHGCVCFVSEIHHLMSLKKESIHRVCHACICRCIFFLLSLHTLRHDFARCLVGLSTFADKGEATVPSFLRNGALMFGILCEQNKAYSCLSWCLKISNDLSWTSGKSWLKEWKGKFGRYVSTRACASGPNVPSFGMHISHRRPSLLCRAVKIAYWDVRHSFLHLPKYFERCHICMRLDT